LYWIYLGITWIAFYFMLSAWLCYI
jgi:hypothetical protein